MANEEHLAKLREGVDAWNIWRKANFTIRPGLDGAKLLRLELSGVDLHDADLRFATLCEANLGFADLNGADLDGADLSGASLNGAYLRQANLNFVKLIRSSLVMVHLNGACLSDANLSFANLTSADLSNADFGDVTFAHTILVDANLRGAQGLETCDHHGPCTLDHRSLAKSWPLPEIFLLRCGLPESLIRYLPSILKDGATSFNSCFISYSTKDQEFADRLYYDLYTKGVLCWFAPHDVQGGKKLHEQIDDAIRMHERLLLILSSDSMNSEWVKTEIRKARKRERTEKKRVLFPVRLVSFDAIRDWELFDADEGKDLATEIREYYIPDFSEWKSHDPYQREFEKLLRDLRTDASAPLSG
jgi:uncharacterized protein YjbI with pentapeptide repeats